MTKKAGNGHEETQIDDLEVFEEWEAGDEAQPEEAGQAPELEVDAPMDEDLNLAELEKPEIPVEEPVTAKTSIEKPAQAPEDNFSDALLDLAPDVPVNLVAVIGKTMTNVGNLMDLRIGNVVDLGRPPGETVDLVVNGRMIARGELVDMDGQLGVRILKIVK